jgi:PIN domain nuclease of toxin-antitoxin system
LLDTQALLWWLGADPTLSDEARSAISGEEPVFVSAASVWEVAIKQGIGRLMAPEDLEQQLERHQFDPLPISARHALVAGALPHHHDDPFDRMLVAQAQVERLTLVTRDPRISQYEVPILRA